MEQKPLILISNDDGITAPGLAALIESVKDLGNIIIVAPYSPQSGMGHAITVSEPLRLEKSTFYEAYHAYFSDGTPADCVKLAVSCILHKKPDLILSGINHGSNSSINSIYSGTVSAAMEGAIESIPGVAFSITDYSIHADFEASKQYVRQVTQQVLQHGIPLGTLLNVNIPTGKPDELKGVRICRQANAKWEENFDERTDPNGRQYYWLVGNFINYDKGEDTDEWALTNNYVAITPIHFDLTAHHAITFLNQWNLNHGY